MKKQTAKGMMFTAVFMAFATLISKVLGLVRDSMLTAYFGSGMESDAFLTASSIPTQLFDVVIGGVISATFIPVFNSIMEKKNKDEAMRFVNKFVTLILLISIAVSVLGIIFASPLVSLQTHYTGDKHILAARLTAIMFPMIIFTGLAFSFVGLLQSFGEYNVPSIISLVSNAAIILYYVIFGKRFGVYGLAVTMIIAWSLQLIIQIPWLKKFGVRYRPDFKFRDDSIKQTIRLAGPMLISTWVQPLYTLINQRLASNAESAVTYIQQSSRLYIIVTGVFSFVVTNLVFPKLAQAVARNDNEEAQSLIVTSLKMIFLVILPIMAVFMAAAEPIANVMYGHGKMSGEGVSAIGNLLSLYSLGMLALAANEVLSKAFFSMQDSKPPMRNSIISMIVNIALAYILYHFMSTPGLALATVGGSITNALLNYICMARKHPGMFKKEDRIGLLKIVLCGVVMCAVMFGSFMLISSKIDTTTIIGSILAVAVCGGISLVIYLALCFVFRIDVLVDLIKNVKGGGKA